MLNKSFPSSVLMLITSLPLVSVDIFKSYPLKEMSMYSLGETLNVLGAYRLGQMHRCPSPCCCCCCEPGDVQVQCLHLELVQCFHLQMLWWYQLQLVQCLCCLLWRVSTEMRQLRSSLPLYYYKVVFSKLRPQCRPRRSCCSNVHSLQHCV